MTTDLIMWFVPKPLLQYVAQILSLAGLVTSYKSFSKVHSTTSVCTNAVGLNHTKAEPITGPEGWANQCLVPLL